MWYDTLLGYRIKYEIQIGIVRFTTNIYLRLVRCICIAAIAVESSLSECYNKVFQFFFPSHDRMCICFSSKVLSYIINQTISLYLFPIFYRTQCLIVQLRVIWNIFIEYESRGSMYIVRHFIFNCFCFFPINLSIVFRWTLSNEV